MTEYLHMESPFDERPLSVDVTVRVTARVQCNNGKTNDEVQADMKDALYQVFAHELMPVGFEGVETAHYEINATIKDG